MAKKGAPYGNKNALGDHNAFRVGATYGLINTIAKVPVLTAAGGAIVGAHNKGKRINDKYVRGAAASGALTGGVVGALGGGPIGAASGAAIGAWAQGVSAAAGVTAGHYGRKGYDYASTKFKKRKK